MKSSVANGSAENVNSSARAVSRRRCATIGRQAGRRKGRALPFVRRDRGRGAPIVLPCSQDLPCQNHEDLQVLTNRSATGIGRACFPIVRGRYRSREVGGGRATRQAGQVRKEAALTS